MTQAMNLKPISASILALLGSFLLLMAPPAARGYTNLSVAVYFRYQEVHSIPANLASFSNQWANIEKQVQISKVYLETTRNAELATESDVTTLKRFFSQRGIKVSGGLGLTANEPNGFQSYCYSTPADCDKVKSMTEFTARFFDEIILDDFFFSNCKCERCIATKGDRSWSEFRTQQMDDVSRNLIIGAARAVNPRVRICIKYPNWYESFQGLGYDLAVEPGLFDSIYTGTETRDANSGQRLQSYQSYLQTQYFNNIKPGGNAGGWIDGGRDVERYAEQMWNTFFAKVPEITLFNSMQIAAPLGLANRGGGSDTNASLAGLALPVTLPDGSSYAPNMVARIAGYSAELLDRFLGQLGKPTGIPTYKPCNSVGEPYLPNYFGMIGVPLDLVPEFPTNARSLFLTAASGHDKGLVAKVKAFVRAGGRAVVTTGLIEALGDKGFQDIVEIQVAGRRVIATGFAGGRRGVASATAQPSAEILLPQIHRFENDNRLSINFETALSGYPMAITCAYGKGTFCVLAVPDDFADLYRLPANALNQIRALLGRDLFVRLDAPDQVGLFAYDNRSFIVQNYRDQAVNARVNVAGAARLVDLLTSQAISTSQPAAAGFGGGFGGGQFGRGGMTEPAGPSFVVGIPGHSFRVFKAE
jgi:hypothetical protein